jgi:hypothetical protein
VKTNIFLFLQIIIIIAINCGDITLDGEVHTCYDSLEEVDEQNKKLIFKLFGGDIDKHYKVFKLIIEVIDKGDHAGVKWTVEYEKLNEDIDAPNGWMDYLSKCTRDIDAHLLKGEKVAL